MNRRGFFHATGGALLALPLAGLLVQACYGNDAPDGDNPAAPPVQSGSNVEYTTNVDDGHSHRFDVATAALAAPVDVQGATTVDDGHSHDVAITAGDLQQVASGTTITITTAVSEGHSHVLTLVKLG
jgi:hypothetical protein